MLNKHKTHKLGHLRTKLDPLDVLNYLRQKKNIEAKTRLSIIKSIRE